MTHEVDASGLTFTPEAISGEIKVIIHDDQYQDMHYDNAIAKMAPSADGPGLGITYQVDIQVAQVEDGADPKLSGSFEGIIGAAIRYEGEIEGSISPEADSLPKQ